MRVLIVDDSADIREAYRLFLETMDFEVEEAEDGEHALAAVARRMPDLVLTDIMMPGMPGFELITHLRSDFARPPRILVLSGFPNIQAEALARGADLFLQKPVEPGDLLACVERLLAGQTPRVDGVQQRTDTRRYQITVDAERVLGALRQNPIAVDRLQYATRWIGALLECDCVTIFIEDGQPHIASSTTPERYSSERERAPLLRCALDIIQSGSSLLVSSAGARAAFGFDQLQIAGCPFRYRNEPVGAICLLRREGHSFDTIDLHSFDTIDLRVLELIMRAASREISSNGERGLMKRYMLSTWPFEELIGLLAQRASPDCPLLIAGILTDERVDALSEERRWANPAATLTQLGPRLLGVLFCGRRSVDTMKVELRKLVQEIDERWGSESVVAFVGQVPSRNIAGGTLLASLRDLLEDKLEHHKRDVFWIEEATHLDH